MSDEQVKGIPELKPRWFLQPVGHDGCGTGGFMQQETRPDASGAEYDPRKYGHTVYVTEADHEQALAALEARFKEHTSAVGRFLLEMYQTMVDPLEDSGLKVAEMCELLLHQAREDREKLNRSPANFPADWNQDSSLETWFPLTAEEFSRTKIALAASQQQVAALEARIAELTKPVTDHEWDVYFYDAPIFVIQRVNDMLAARAALKGAS